MSLIEKSLAFDLGLEGPKHHLKVQWSNNMFNEDNDSQVVSISIKGIDRDKSYLLRRVRTISGMALPTQTIDCESLSEIYPYMKSFKHLSYINA